MSSTLSDVTSSSAFIKTGKEMGEKAVVHAKGLASSIGWKFVLFIMLILLFGWVHKYSGLNNPIY